MSGIRKIDNKVKIGATKKPWGGSVVDLQYSISFQGPSSLSVTVANKDGEYDNPELNAQNPTLVEFGEAKMNMLPISYRKSKGAGGRTLRVDFEDMGLRYLDKNIVLLRDQHLNVADDEVVGAGGCTIVLGKLFADDVNGLEKRYYGIWKSNIVRVKYDIRDLAFGIKEAGVPISQRFYDYLSKFRAYPPFAPVTDESGNTVSVDPPSSFLRSEVGPLRDVLGSVSNELGFVFFWNNADGIEENFDDTKVLKPAGASEFEGFLDFVEFKEDIDTERIKETIEKVSESCNVEDDSFEVSIKDSYVKGGIGFFAVEPTFDVGGFNRFNRFKFGDTIESPYAHPPGFSGSTNKVNAAAYEVKMLMKAAMVGPNFYARYVMQKLTAYYISIIDADTDRGVYTTLKERTQGDPPAADADPFAYMGQSILGEGANGEDWKINTVLNDAVTQLYAAEFVLLPCVYSEPYSEAKGAEGGNPPVLSWKDPAGDNLPPASEEMGDDDRWMTVFTDESFIEKLRSTSEFVGVAYVNNESIRTFLENPDKCPIYQQAKFLAENYGKWYSFGGGGLLVETAYTARSYTEATSWVFSDTAVTETQLAEIYSFTYSKTDSEGNPIPPNYDEAVYRMVLAGQSNCGNSLADPEIIRPTNRMVETEIDRADGVVESYKNIIGIRAMLRSSRGANAEGGRTGCRGGITQVKEVEGVDQIVVTADSNTNDEDFIDNLDQTDEQDIDGFAVESRQRRSNTNTDDVAGDDLILGGVIPAGGLAKSLTSAGYAKIQEYRGSCVDTEKCPEAFKENPDGSQGEGVCFSYPPDKDYGVVLHDASASVSSGNIDGELTYSNYGKGNDVGENDLWYKSGSAYFALEIVQLSLDATGAEESPVKGVPESRSTQFGQRLVDWWDYNLDREVTLAAGSQLLASNSKIIGFSYTIDFLLQSLRAAFIPDETATTDGVNNFSKAGSIEVEEVQFDMGEVVKSDTNRFEFPLCEDTSLDLNFEEAAANLIAIMKNYVEKNISESISRDFVVSGYGFNIAGSDAACEPKMYLPTIHEGLESISMSLAGDSGIRTTIKIGNKRRKRASANLRREMIVRGMPQATSRALVPNSVNSAFSTGLQTKI